MATSDLFGNPGASVILPAGPQLSPKAVVEATIAEHRSSPIDLLNLNDGEGELKYMRMLQSSYERTIRDLATHFAGSPGKEDVHVLEIGAYLGVVSVSLRKYGFKVSATDLPDFASNPRLQRRYAHYGIDLVAANLRQYKLAFPDQRFDAVVMCEVLEHLNFNPLPVIYEINRVLKPGGLLYLALPNLVCLKNRLNMVRGKSAHDPIESFFAQLNPGRNMIVGIHWREYTIAEVRAIVERLGFSILRQAFFDLSVPANDGWLLTLTKRVLYGAVPSFKPNQVTFAVKERRPELDFHLCDATR
jgi:2-polyprenyl-3-methyl-5-hydroxy-6-metoxy-1,4-benzoquinol methylase